MYAASRRTRNTSNIRSRFASNLSRNTNIPSYMRPTASWRNRIRSYGSTTRNRRRPWERDEIRRNNRNTRSRNRILQETPSLIPKPEATEEEPPVEEEELAKVLTVKSIDLNIKENTKNHHTDKYENTEERERDGKTLEAELVIRRAAEFEMTIEFSRPYNKVQDDLHLTFKTGKEPLPKSLTIANIKLEEGNNISYKPDNWGARIVKKRGNSMTVAVYVPAKCVIGEWEFNVKTVVDGENGEKVIYQYEYPDDIYILLNPWSKDDACYFSPEKGLDEYILNDGGALWYGNYRQRGARGWNFAQFADGILETSMHLLRKAFGTTIDGNMGNPVYIARALSKIINSNDDEGVLTGKWSGKYDDGTRPTAWTGSLGILKKYTETDEPVKYGQCWVFSGVLTTVCRAVGLPCRSVTNFASAHDTNLSCTIDKVFALNEDMELEKVARFSNDSVWNFHVWNEVWMKREDLPQGYDGWQVIDATPQERSDGYFMLGPSPVSAVKKGETNIGYDTPFVYGEVNADAIEWFLENEDEYYVMNIDKHKVGKFISTKKATGNGYRGSRRRNELDREDLTDEYKYREGTKEERESMELAHKLSNSGKDPYLEDPIIEIHMDEIDEIAFGDDFEYKLSVKNIGKEERLVTPYIKLEVMMYNGKVVDKILTERFQETLIKGGHIETFKVKVPAEKYMPLTIEHFSIEATAFCSIRDQRRFILNEDVFRLTMPELTIEAPNTCRPGETFDVLIYFDNPIDKPLTDCRLTIEGSLRTPEIENGGTLELSDVPAKTRFEQKLSFKPKSRIPMNRECDLFLSFDCKELPDIVGNHIIEVSF